MRNEGFPKSDDTWTLTVHGGNTTSHIHVEAGQSIRDALDLTSLRVRAACGGIGTCGACKVRLLGGSVAAPTVAEYMKLSQGERDDGVRLACQLRLSGDVEIILDDPAPPSPWKSIRPGNLGTPMGALPHLERHVYGLAVDLGTTHIRLALWDRKAGRRIATRTGANPQAAFGADVLNRLDASLVSPDRTGQIAVLARDAILHGLHDMLARDVGEVTPMMAEIGQVVLVGNTAMVALLTEIGAAALIDPANWLRSIDYQPSRREDWQSKWRMPHAKFLVPAPVAGFIGCDLLADCIATHILDDLPGTLLLDIGTNTEIALWDGKTLHVTSVPGGPAFEGAGIQNGMAAEAGAISRVQRSQSGAAFNCAIIGQDEATGLCGSGLVDGVAVLLGAGLLKPSGRFSVAPGPEGFALIPDNPRSAIAGRAVDAFQRAKAAVAAAQEELLRAAGMTGGDLLRLIVCGAFGRHLDISNAQQVGLLPMIDADRVELHADAALAGAEQALLNDDAADLFTQLRDKTNGINLAIINGYEDHFVGHLRLRPFGPLVD